VAILMVFVACGSDSKTTPVANSDKLADACLTQVNSFRAMAGSSPVERWTDGELCTVGEATKGGDDFNSSGTIIFHQYYPECGEQYQNECWYSASSANDVLTYCNQAFFDEGPPSSGINHYSVMTDPKAKHVACEIYHIPDPKGGWYMTQNYISH
jgi:hypothetical protein